MMGRGGRTRKVLSAEGSRTTLAAMSRSAPRIFVAQTLADSWLSAREVQLERDLLRLAEAGGGPVTHLFINPAVFFERIDGTDTDVHDVVGRVKTAQELAQMGADHYESSVVMGDYAYTVVPGYLATPVDAKGAEQALDGGAWTRLVGQLESFGS